MPTQKNCFRCVNLYVMTIPTPSPSYKSLNKMIDLFKNAFRYIMQEMCNDAVRIEPHSLAFVPDHFKAQGVCNDAVRIKPVSLVHVPDRSKAQEMCKKTVRMDPWLLNYVPDWFVKQQQIKLWDDDDDY